MRIPTPREIEALSAYLDEHLSKREKERLEERLHSDPALATALEELRQTRLLLRRTPQRRAPRNFTLKPGMVGIRPPLPRFVPALSWASAVAGLLFLFTVGASLAGNLSAGVAAPMMAAAPNTVAGSAQASATQAPALLAPATAAPATSLPATADQTLLATPTPEAAVMSAPQAVSPNAQRSVKAATTNTRPSPLKTWLFILPGLAILLEASALLLGWWNRRAFQRKNTAK